MARLPSVLTQRPSPLLPPSGARPPSREWHDGLTDKQRAFVDHYAEHRNATQAYTYAYDTNATYEVRRNEGAKLTRNPLIQEALRLRVAQATFASGSSVQWLLQRFLAIGTADPRELIGLKVGACRYCWGQDHLYHWREREYLEALDEAERLQREQPNMAAKYPDPAGGLDYNATKAPHPDCPQCHGEGVERFVPRDTDKLSDQAVLLYGGVKVKKDGYEIIIADRQKALELAGRIMGAFNDRMNVTGAIANFHALGDLRDMNPADAAKAYREFVAGNIASS